MTVLSVHDTLVAARALLADPDRWTQSGWFAVDADGVHVDHWSPRACAWCMAGAVRKVLTFERDMTRWVCYHDAIEALQVPSGRVGAFNDSTGTSHADMLALFDRAIEATA